MLAGAHKKFYRVQHSKLHLLDLKVQYILKMKLPLDMVSEHVLCTSPSLTILASWRAHKPTNPLPSVG